MDVTIFWFVVYALATARLTRLVVSDRLTLRWRLAVIKKYGEDSLPTYFMFCPWCISMWIAPWAALAFIGMVYPFGIKWLLVIPITFAYSHLTGLIARLDRGE